MEKLNMDQMFSYEPFESSGHEQPTKLKNFVEISKLCSDTGAVFEVEEMDKATTVNSSVEEQDVGYAPEDLSNEMLIGQDFGEDDCEDSDDNISGNFQHLAKTMEDISGDGGVLKEILTPGIGSDLPKGSTITFHYSGYFEGDDEPFDSTYFRNKPQQACLESPDVVIGLAIGLKTMRLREKARFLIQPQYAFGSLGCPPRIPANETILFEAAIINAIDFYASDCYDASNEEIKKKATFQEKLEVSLSFRRKANSFHSKGEYIKAKEHYEKAIRVIDSCRIKDQEESDQQCEALAVTHCNLAQVFLNLKEPARACTACRHALDTPVKLSLDLRSKIFFRFANAKMLLDDYDSALKYLRKAHVLKPNNADITKLYETLSKKEKLYKEREKLMYKMMLSGPNNNLSDDKTSNSETKAEITNSHTKEDLDDSDSNFKTTILCRIKSLCEADNLSEIMLPANLSKQEVDFVLEAAKKANLDVHQIRNKQRLILKLIKKQ